MPNSSTRSQLKSAPTRKPAKKAAAKTVRESQAGPALPTSGKSRVDPTKPKAVKTETSRHVNAGRTFYELARMNAKELQEIFDHGVTPAFSELVGYEFRGFNPPIFARILGFQKFKKGFFCDDGQRVDGEVISGYNVFVRQNGLEDPHIATPTEDNPRRHGFYLVEHVHPAGTDNKYPHALLLDYGRGKNSPANPERVIRDYVVRVDPENPDLFLGKAFLAIGGMRIFSNFFILDRYNEANFDPETIG